jgi:hypothetical protein
LFAVALVGILTLTPQHRLIPEIDKTSLKSTAYIDIKSEGLRDILRIVLKDIKWLSLGEDKPAVSSILYDVPGRL